MAVSPKQLTFSPQIVDSWERYIDKALLEKREPTSDGRWQISCSMLSTVGNLTQPDLNELERRYLAAGWRSFERHSDDGDYWFELC